MSSLVSSILFLLAASAEEPVEEALPIDVATASPVLDADAAVSFGDHLLRNDDPFNALTYYRLAAFLDEGRDPGPLSFRQALCYERGERWEAAERAWLDVASSVPALAPRATYRAGLTLLESGDTGVARLHLQEVRLEDAASPWAARARYVEALTRLRDGDLDLAEQAFAVFLDAHPDHALTLQATRASELLNTAPKRRSPALAGLMSTVLPGSGQIYAGHAGDGVLAFFAAGTLAAWSGTMIVYGVERDRAWATASGSVLGSIALFNWVSNVSGAVRGAKRTNRHHARKKADAVLEATAHPSLERDPRDVSLP